MNVAIIGHGFVGKALENGLQNNVKTMIIDPIYNNKISDLNEFSPEIIFVCVPTPTYDNGTQDISILNNVIDDISLLSTKAITVLKSTILPTNLVNIKKINDSIVYNPEFLRESNANEDFINSELIVFGGDKDNTKMIENFYINFTKCINKDYIHTDIITASFIKYTINTFLATKVTFFNELFNLFKNSGAKDTWQNFINAVSVDKRIGKSHMQVPGSDNKFGYGGNCFPKDSQAFLNYSDVKGNNLKLLKKSIKINKKIRN